VTSSYSGRVPTIVGRFRWALPMQLIEKAVMHVHWGVDVIVMWNAAHLHISYRKEMILSTSVAR
jgi:hypothetical protein